MPWSGDISFGVEISTEESVRSSNNGLRRMPLFFRIPRQNSARPLSYVSRRGTPTLTRLTDILPGVWRPECVSIPGQYDSLLSFSYLHFSADAEQGVSQCGGVDQEIKNSPGSLSLKYFHLQTNKAEFALITSLRANNLPAPLASPSSSIRRLTFCPTDHSA